MNNTIQIIPLDSLALAFIPVFIVVGILFKWSLDYKNALYGLSRMLMQLLLIGYFLNFIFESDNFWIVLSILSIMVLSASWIGLRTVPTKRRTLYMQALYSILIGGGLTFILITQGVLGFEPWYAPRYIIPLAGMIFAGSMNAVSLAAERFGAEAQRGISYLQARNIAFKASLIPLTNSLFAVGLVSLPGMMTGQILSGISPLIAVRYQIMVMCMIYGAAGISTAIFLMLIKSHLAEFQKKES